MRHASAVTLALAMLMPLAQAAQEAVGSAAESGWNEKSLQEAYAGIVIDETITVAGHEFYQYFTALWQTREISSRYTISIHERPSARWGSQIWIEYNQRRVFQAFLPAARAKVQAVSEQAAEVAFEQIVETEVQRLLFRDPDLGRDEM